MRDRLQPGPFRRLPQSGDGFGRNADTGQELLDNFAPATSREELAARCCCQGIGLVLATGGSNSVSLVMAAPRAVASTARTAPEERPWTAAVPPTSLTRASRSSISRSTV
jgi:hypothetical protein